mmetsp:Transcript_15936/g.24634  ORF Transcript_15936/g.24634 Transcript_15936/m.24634 type:complete len:119 (+) Transcript_15936:862-1218(+)
MKYYYAIVHCNTPKTALTLYDEYNGFEFENTNIRLNISLVPDGVEFKQERKDVATDIPANFEFDFEKYQKINRAMGHSDVKLTWDQTDKHREAKLHKGFTNNFDNSEDEAEYYKDLIR